MQGTAETQSPSIVRAKKPANNCQLCSLIGPRRLGKVGPVVTAMPPISGMHPFPATLLEGLLNRQNPRLCVDTWTNPKRESSRRPSWKAGFAVESRSEPIVSRRPLTAIRSDRRLLLLRQRPESKEWVAPGKNRSHGGTAAQRCRDLEDQRNSLVSFVPPCESRQLHWHGSRRSAVGQTSPDPVGGSSPSRGFVLFVVAVGVQGVVGIEE